MALLTANAQIVSNLNKHIRDFNQRCNPRTQLDPAVPFEKATSDPSAEFFNMAAVMLDLEMLMAGGILMVDGSVMPNDSAMLIAGVSNMLIPDSSLQAVGSMKYECTKANPRTGTPCNPFFHAVFRP
jgi:hypothetical protein